MAALSPNPQKVLVLQTADPAYVRRAMEGVLAMRLLGHVRITLFCRALTEDAAQFRQIQWIDELVVHDETRAAARHMKRFRTEHFDVVVVFLSGDPSYWKMKCFAFACGGRHLLIFNEHLGCFFYTHAAFGRFLLARYREWKVRTRQKMGHALGTPTGFIPEPVLPGLAMLRSLHLFLKLLIFPFRWAYLLAWCGYMQLIRRRYLRRCGNNLTFEGDA